MKPLSQPTQFTFPALSLKNTRKNDREQMEISLEKYYIKIPDTFASKIIIDVTILPNPDNNEFPKFLMLHVIGRTAVVDEERKIKYEAKMATKYAEFIMKTNYFRMPLQSQIDFTSLNEDFACNILLFYSEPVDHDVTVMISPFVVK